MAALVLLLILLYHCAGSELPYTIHRANSTDTGLSTAELFDAIATTDYWESRHLGTACGPGSSDRYTDYIRAFVTAMQFRYNFPIVVDVSCGDLPWQLQSIKMARDMLAWHTPEVFPFVALDISQVMLQGARRRAEGVGMVYVDRMDVTQDRLIVEGGLVICRDTLQHLPIADAMNALKLIANSGASMLILGGYDDNRVGNVNIRTGQYYLFNPRLAPFLIDRDKGLLMVNLEDTLIFNGARKFVYVIDLTIMRQSPLYQL